MTKPLIGCLILFLALLHPYEKTVFAGQIEQERTISSQKNRQILVQYKKDTGSEEKAIIQNNLPEKAASVRALGRQTELLMFQDAAQTEEVLAELQQDPSVEKAEKNRISFLASSANDPYFSAQWWLPLIQAPDVWPMESDQKKSVTVAVVDSGLDFHPDLVNRTAPGGYDLYLNTDVMTDPNGHGTNVAGVIAAQTNNHIGIAGVGGGFDIRILPIRVANYKGEAYVSDIIKAIDYAISQKVDIINISMSSTAPSTFEREAVERADKAGIIVVAASGNAGSDGNPLSYPASYESVISVASINKYKQHSSFSTYNSFVDIAAPGESILTTGRNGSYSTVSGTSFSSPVAAGVLAMMKGMNPFITPETAAQLITGTAEDLGSTGFDEEFGHGLVNMKKAVNAATQLTSAIAAEWREFAPMIVDRQKVFTVSFNYPVDAAGGTVYVATNPDGTNPISGYTSTVQKAAPTKVEVRPNTEWTPGIYYIIVDDTVKSVDGRMHKKKTQMRFIVK